jgi:hypothetical protein
MTKNTFPKFLSSKPTGEDKFAGGSHKKTAKIISETIRKESLEKRVIGLEGEWGSGKSNVIKIIQDELGKEYYTFIFDSWGNQEDLTRKSFLEQLIGQLFKNDFLKDSKKWLKLENQLLSKTSKIHKEKFPQTKSYWVLLTLSILSLAGFSSFYENVLSLNHDIIKGIDFGPFWKPLLAIYLIPLLLFVWAFLLGTIDYFKKREENSKKEKQKQENKWDTLGKIFYWFSGQEIDTEEVENVLEEEPSVKKFREYFSKIEEDIKNNKKKLVIVFDNIDRLEEDKIKSLWSSIHTFFAEGTEYFSSWIIVPYDKIKLNGHFGGNGFIEKTFAINFRVTPPIVTEWETFLDQCIDDAFGKEIIPIKEKEFIIKLYDILSSVKTIKPRQIINYVNDLVALYLQWEKEVISEEIKFRYLALFILTKDEIVDNPNEVILSRNYLKVAINQFEDRAELDECISALTFGVEKKLANEVLLLREIQTVLREGNNERLNGFSNHTAFDNYFHKAYFSVELADKINGLANILKTASNYLSDNRKSLYWNDFAKKIASDDIEGEFEEFNDNHKAILKNTNKKIGRNVLSKLIKELKGNIDSSAAQEKYFSQILQVEEFISNESIDIDFVSLITKVRFNAESYLKFIAKAKNNYKKYKINCTQQELDEWFSGDFDDLDVETINDNLDELEIILDEYKMIKIIEGISAKIKTVVHSDKDNLAIYLKILKTLSKRPIKLELSAQFYGQLTSAKIDSDEIYIDAYCIAISDFQVSHSNSSNFQNSLRSLTEEQIRKVSSKIEWYIHYEGLLKLLSTNASAVGFTKLKDIASDITINSYGSSALNINWALKEFDNIAVKVFNDDDEQVKNFVEKLSIWHMHYKTKVTTIADGFFEYLNHKELKLVELIINDSLIHFENLTKKEIIESFKTKNKNFKMFNALFNNDLIDKYSDAFYSSYDDYMKDIATEKEAIPEVGFWDDLIEKLNGNKLRSTYTSIRDTFINERGDLKESELHFFERGLINYGNLSKKPESSTLKIIIPLIESDKNFSVFLNNKDVLVNIINLSKEHRETVLGELQLRYNSEKYKNDEEMIEVAQLLGLKKESEYNNDDNPG